MDEHKNKSRSWLSRLASKDIRVDNGEVEIVDETQAQQKRHRLRNRLTLIGLPFLLVVVIGWFIAGLYLSKFQIGDNLASVHQSNDSLQKLVENQAKTYLLAIKYPDGSSKQFSLNDMGLEIDLNSSLKNMRLVQHQFGNRFFWWQPIKVNLSVEADNNVLNKFIDKQATVTIQPAKDATLTISHGSAVIGDSVAGKHYSLTGPVPTLETAVSRLQSMSLKLELLSLRPAITSKQLEPYQAKLKSIIGQSVNFTIGSKQIQASPNDIADWIELTSNQSGKSINVTINSGKVLAYINKISASSIHPPKAQVEVTRDDGTTTVLAPGVSGTDVVNKSSVASDVTQSLLSNNAVSENLEISYADYKTVDAEAYPKWIEVDTTNKRMYAYEQSTQVKSFLVSAGAPLTPTVTGQYSIYAKFVQQDMRGQNVDGSNYFQPKVPWVNYFYGGYAIHGNYWRPLTWFGNINSSHGCIGVSTADGEWIYDWAPIGTPVIIHT